MGEDLRTPLCSTRPLAGRVTIPATVRRPASRSGPTARPRRWAPQTAIAGSVAQPSPGPPSAVSTAAARVPAGSAHGAVVPPGHDAVRADQHGRALPQPVRPRQRPALVGQPAAGHVHLQRQPGQPGRGGPPSLPRPGPASTVSRSSNRSSVLHRRPWWRTHTCGARSPGRAARPCPVGRAGSAGAGDHRRPVATAQVAGQPVVRVPVAGARSERSGVGPPDRLALGGVAVQQRVAGQPAQHPGQPPAQLVAVVDRGVHADPADRGHPVRGVADQEPRARAGSSSASSAAMVNGRTPRISGLQLRQPGGRPQQRAPTLRGVVGRGLAALRIPLVGERPAPVADRQQHALAVRVLHARSARAAGARSAAARGPAGTAPGRTRPRVPSRCPADAQRGAHRAARAVGADHEPGPHPAAGRRARRAPRTRRRCAAR